MLDELGEHSCPHSLEQTMKLRPKNPHRHLPLIPTHQSIFTTVVLQLPDLQGLPRSRWGWPLLVLREVTQDLPSLSKQARTVDL